MHIDVVGSGPDLVLIHGWAMHSAIFAPLTQLLTEHFRLRLVDLPGHGRTHVATPGALDPTICARAIAAQTPPAIWLGWSLGGLVALHAALDHSSGVRGLIEIAASPKFVRSDNWPHAVDCAVFDEFAIGLGNNYRGTIERFLALETLGSPHAQSELRALKQQVFDRGEPDTAVLCEGLKILETTDLRARLAELTVPNLWIGGRRDRLVPPAAMRWAAQHSPRGQWLEINSGHAPFVSDAPAVATAIREFADALKST
ncbi:MAG: pimeloyl-ACP methyl ester esterase BioH [Dokdonella sp.]